MHPFALSDPSVYRSVCYHRPHIFDMSRSSSSYWLGQGTNPFVHKTCTLHIDVRRNSLQLAFGWKMHFPPHCAEISITFREIYNAVRVLITAHGPGLYYWSSSGIDRQVSH